MFGKDIPTIKPHSQTVIVDEEADRAPPIENWAEFKGKRVWMLRVKNEAALERLVAFLATDEGISELRPRYPYDAQKQRDYRARKKAKEQAASEL